ncbi:hypothetical protein ACS60E_03160 [Streptococcus suis]
MEINVSGTSSYREVFVNSINSSGEYKDIKANLVNFNSINEYYSDILLLFFDGLPIDFVLNQKIKNTGLAIPIFIDTNNIYICGSFKSEYFEGETCSCCIMKRLKENIGLSEMFNHIFSQTTFSKIESLTVFRVNNFIVALLKYLLNGPEKFSKNLLTYSLDIECFKLSKIIGYTGCPKCDKNTYTVEKMIAELGE